ncbi:MAG: chorismate mutase [Erysipelotrichaceae bacterium]|jgi:monofunctional chorismate mutase|nr:chorismate mutase [Erysipelotrichaceae bacterium]
MSRLEDDRRQIDEIDAELAALFERRFAVVRDIIEYKIENRLPILDSSREKEIIEKNAARISDDDMRIYFRKLYMDMLDLSREFQDDIVKEK